MLQSLLSALKSTIRFIQLKLTDFGDEPPTVDKVLTEQFIKRDQPRHVTNELILLADHHFELLHPVCPFCGDDRVTKQEFRSRTPILGSFGLQKLYLRRYRCTICGKKFTTPLYAVVAPYQRYASVFKDAAAKMIQTGYRPLRKLRDDLNTTFGIAPSHQAIQNWLVVGEEKGIQSASSQYSGYYCYDEQHITLAGQKQYRLTLFDSILNIPVAEEIAADCGYQTVYAFLKGSLHERPLVAITTDHKREYKGILDELGAAHQLCIFHLYKMIGDVVYAALESKRYSYRDKIKFCLYFTAIKNVFRTDDLQVAQERLERLLDDYWDIPRGLRGFITGKILPDFERLTFFMRDGLVSKTTNPVENYYRQTDPESTKKEYKTSRGVLSYLAQKMVHWTVKFGRLSQPPTS
jgi:transposase-like protein